MNNIINMLKINKKNSIMMGLEKKKYLEAFKLQRPYGEQRDKAGDILLSHWPQTSNQPPT